MCPRSACLHYQAQQVFPILDFGIPPFGKWDRKPTQEKILSNSAYALMLQSYSADRGDTKSYDIFLVSHQ